MIINEYSYICSGLTKYDWHIPRSWDQPTWLNDIMHWTPSVWICAWSSWPVLVPRVIILADVCWWSMIYCWAQFCTWGGLLVEDGAQGFRGSGNEGGSVSSQLENSRVPKGAIILWCRNKAFTPLYVFMNSTVYSHLGHFSFISCPPHTVPQTFSHGFTNSHVLMC